jgi:cyclopropane-fatty-acyl-phospholipid synthase
VIALAGKAMRLAGNLASAIGSAAFRRLFFTIVGRIKVGSIAVEESGGAVRHFDSGSPGPSATLQILDSSFYRRLLLEGEVSFGESYQAGLYVSPDMVSLLELAILNRRVVNLNAGPLRLLARRKNLRLHRGRENTLDQSRENIQDHYDLGNDFFGLFLDETMTYSSAVFEEESQALADAQRNKYRRITEFANIVPGDHVLEIGSGWGGFAIYAAGTLGCRVTTITISKEQQVLALKRVEQAGLSDLIEIKIIDYRDVTGTYDKIVSIEMFEAVGVEYFETFFMKCASLLQPGGRLAMQVITVPDGAFEAQKTGVNWIQKYIFPGGVLPSLAEMERVNAHTGLLLNRVEDIGAHYATTLHQWRERFWKRMDDVRTQGYDEYFVKTWDYYLAACEAGFLTRNTSDVQIAFTKVG